MWLPPHVLKNRESLRLMGNELWREFKAPVYLVGSILNNKNAKDWDVRIELRDRLFVTRFGSLNDWNFIVSKGAWFDLNWNWFKVCKELSDKYSSLLDLTLDIQIYPYSFAQKFKGKIKYKIS